tara:strand:- start:3776 stop:4444 length:669 start_codon:yes stop_codon:yes gene_type:complete
MLVATLTASHAACTTPPIRVAIELSFGALMSPKEHASVSNQIKRAFGHNKAARKPVSLHLTSLSSASEYPAMLGSCVGWRSWPDVECIESAAHEHWPTNAVWLSPDAPDALETLSPDDVYVVGGFVDRSVKKGETLRRAEAAGVRAVRLPVAEHAARSDLHPILSINTVVQILGEVHAGSGWSGALATHVPARYVKRRELEEAARVSAELADDVGVDLGDLK